MLFLVTGASGVGKTSVRRLAAPRLANAVECVELAHLAEIPADPDEDWRREVVARAVARAAELEPERHLLLCGDPILPSEVFAAPQAAELSGGAVLLLDASPDVQTVRLQERDDPAELLPHHLAFQDYLRTAVREATGPPGRRWASDEVDTDGCSPAEVAREVVAWVRRHLP